ncbi:unnamed protein product, partial [Cyprideis torosa]
LLSAAGERQLLLHQEIALLEDVRSAKPSKRNASHLEEGNSRPPKKAKGDTGVSSSSSSTASNASGTSASARKTKVKAVPSPAPPPLAAEGEPPPPVAPSTSSAPTSLVIPRTPPPFHPSEGHASPVITLKYDVPNKFWKFVEQFCGKVSSDDIEYLDQLIAERTDEGHAELLTVPPLGTHYTLKWAEEDQVSGGAGKKGKGGSASASPAQDGQPTSGPTPVRFSEDIPPYGPLTTRLVSSLISESVGDPSIEIPNEEVKTEKDRKGIIRALSSPNAPLLEKRIKKELEDEGFLETESSEDDGDDEILRELKRCQAELEHVSSINLSQLRKIRERAAAQLKRQSVLDDLDAIDEQVQEAYRKLTDLRRKKKSPCKKDKEGVQKLLKDREKILRKLDSI